MDTTKNYVISQNSMLSSISMNDKQQASSNKFGISLTIVRYESVVHFC